VSAIDPVFADDTLSNNFFQEGDRPANVIAHTKMPEQRYLPPSQGVPISSAHTTQTVVVWLSDCNENVLDSFTSTVIMQPLTHKAWKARDGLLVDLPDREFIPAFKQGPKIRAKVVKYSNLSFDPDLFAG
jgi:hypothetical protein